MKKIFLSFLVLLANISSTNKMAGEVLYTVSLNKVTLSKNGKEINPKIKEIFKNAHDVDYQLIFNSNSSFYKKVKRMSNDSDKHINLTEIEAGGNNVYFYDAETKDNIYTKTVGSDKILITQNSFEWKLINSEKKIGKYNCLKAIALNDNLEETRIYAWYAPEIPLPFGPKNFNGLPGLIMELNSGKSTYKVSKIKFSDKEKVINKPEEGIKLTYDEFKERFKGFFDEN